MRRGGREKWDLQGGAGLATLRSKRARLERDHSYTGKDTGGPTVEDRCNNHLRRAPMVFRENRIKE